MKKRLLLLLILGLQALFSFAQNYPVRVTPQVIPPYPASFSGYADTGVMNSPVRVQLTLNDITSPARTIRLKVSVTGNGIQATSTPQVIGAPNLVLDAGVPLQLSITELAPYFRLENLQGISSTQYNSSLPDGSYQFCFEVFDVFTGNRLSGTSCATVFLINNDPPFLNKPDNESRITEQNPTNIVFQWTPRHINVPNVSYEFSIVEVWDTYVNPQTIFVSSPPLYQEITTQTSMLYGPLQPLLLPGKRYAWRVRAFATNNGEEVSVFNNYGNSEIFWFDYQKNCEIPTQLKVEDVQLSRATISWIGHPDHLDYTVHYRESGSEQWYTKTTPRDYITIDEFKPDTVYEYKVSGNCEVDSFGVSQVENFKTLSKELSEYTACGIEADPVDLSNQELLTALYPDDIFTAGDFPVYVKKVTSSGGSFTGEGYISTPWLATVRIPVTFDNIQINTDYQLVAGLVRTTYDPNWDSIIDADDIIEEIVGDDGDIDIIKVDADITDIQVGDDGKIIIITSDGVKIEQPGGEDVVCVDNTGETWSVSEDGTVTKGEVAEGGPATAANTAGVGSGGVHQITAKGVAVTFVKSGYYSFDELPKNAGGTLADQYETVPGAGKESYVIPYKAVSNLGKHTSDVLEARVSFTNSEYSKEDIIFKTKEGIKIPFTWNKSGDIATLSIKKQFDFGKQQIIATLKPKDTTQKYTVAGAVNLWHLASQKVTDIDVTIIPVNGASVSKSIGQQINDIYNPSGVNFKVSVANSFMIDQTIWDLNGNGMLDIGDSGALAHYSEEERALRSYFKTQHTYNPKTYYVFVLGDDMQPSKSGTKGFMPLKRQYGFIFDQKDPAHTIAHELGHGIFGLEHPFTEYKTTQTTNLLMDYGSGTDFTHMDWEKMHAPGIQLYLFQDDEDGEQIVTGLKHLEDFANRDKKNKIISYSFITPSNKLVTLPPNVTDVNFSTYDSYYFVKSGKNAGLNAPMGSLLGFTLNKKDYSFKGSGIKYAYKCDDCIAEDKVYKDVYTKDITSYKDAIIALPYFNLETQKIELYVNKIEVETNQVVSKTNDVKFFGAVSSNFSVIKDLNNPKTGEEGGYFLNATQKGKQIKSVNYTKLTPFAKKFLNSFPENLLNMGSMYAPVIVSSALVFSENEALEKLIECEVIGIKNNQKRSLAQIEKSSKRFVPLLSLTKTFRRGDSHLHHKAKFKQTLEYYLKLRELLKFPGKVEELHASLNMQLSSSTMTPAKIVSLVNASTPCALENVTFQNRIKAIKKLVKSHSTFFDTGEEKAMVNLLSAVTYNGQSKQLLTELFKKDNAKLFRKIWDHTNFSSHQKYINKITEIYKIDKTGATPTKTISFKRLEGRGSSEIEHFFNPNDGSYTIDFIRDPSFASRETVTHKFDSLDELVEVTFPVSDSYIKYKDVQKKDETVHLPAFYLKYLIHKHNKGQIFTAIRVLGNLVAIITAVPTGGQSVTLVAGISAAVASADMVMVFSEDALKQTKDGREFVKIWTTITMIEGGVGLSKLGIAIGKKGINSLRKISFDFKKFDNIKDLSVVQREKILEQIRKVPGLLSKLGNTAVKTMFATKILSKLEASLLNASLTTITQAKLKITDWTQGSIALGGKIHELLKISHSSNGAFSKLLNIRKTTQSSDKLIGALDDIRYQKPNSNSIVEGDVAIYKTADDVVYTQVLPKDSKLVNFLKYIENNPGFKANYEGLSKEMQALFRNDFVNASEDVLKALKKENSVFFKNWKKFRGNNKKKIICN